MGARPLSYEDVNDARAYASVMGARPLSYEDVDGWRASRAGVRDGCSTAVIRADAARASVMLARDAADDRAVCLAWARATLDARCAARVEARRGTLGALAALRSASDARAWLGAGGTLGDGARVIAAVRATLEGGDGVGKARAVELDGRGIGGARAGGSGRRARVVAPAWVRPPGTSFIVDGFEWDLGRGKRCSSWFLTHFHADHTRGLTKGFDRGAVYASRVTTELVRRKIGVDASRLRALDVGVTTRVDGVDVTLLEANHCPGAVMILFEFPDRPTAAPVLHTGDFRFHEGMTRDPTLVRIASAAIRPVLILDTTYCSLEHDEFPSQERVLSSVRDALIHEDNLGGSRKLFLFGTYTIGKEKVFFEAARALGRKVYVGAMKRSILDAIDLSREERDAITTDDKRTNLHVVPMSSTSFSKMAAILKYYKSRFDTVIAFRPTGWTFSAQKKTSRATARRQRGRLVQYGLPYSEHSSLSEMRAFVRFMNPKAIFPHVGNDGKEALERMLKLLRATDVEYDEMRRAASERAK